MIAGDETRALVDPELAAFAMAFLDEMDGMRCWPAKTLLVKIGGLLYRAAGTKGDRDAGSGPRGITGFIRDI